MMYSNCLESISISSNNLNARTSLGSVFCVSMDPLSFSHVVSGGEDDKAYVWKVSDGTVKFTCNGKSYFFHNILTMPFVLDIHD